MQPTSYSKIIVQETELSSLIQMYCDWVLGINDFGKKRESRLKIGLPVTLTLDDLKIGGDFGTPEISNIRSRYDEEEGKWLLHWTHLDANQQTMTWHNIVRLEENGLGISAEHLVGRVFAPDMCPLPVWERPAVISQIVDKFGNRLLPKDLFKDTAIRINAGEIEYFAKFVLLNPERTAPIILVSPQNSTGDYPVNPDFLAKRLVGMTPVVCLTSPAACWELEEVLEEAFFDSGFSCYDGAIRLYWPELRRISDPYDHPLWTANRLYAIPDKLRGKRALGLIGEALSQQVSTHSWLSIIEDIDLSKWRRHAEALLKAESISDPQGGSVTAELQSAIEQRDQQIHELRENLKEAVHQMNYAEELQRYFADEHKKISDQVNNQKEKIGRLEEGLGDAKLKILGFENIRSAKDALMLAKRVFSDRLIIAETAIESIDCCRYRKPKDLFTVLSILALSGLDGGTFIVTDVIKKLMGGRADNKNHDSKETEKKFGTERTFLSAAGGRKLFKKHVTIGGGMDEQACMQIYYGYLPLGKVEIVYAGKHLRTIGQDV